MSFDTIIRGGTVVDGSGLPKRKADVGIKGGVVTDIGRLSGARQTVDADGLVVMPGIIDVHTHYDPQLSFDPYATSSCFHGVTSVVAGNCGYSIAPCARKDHEWLTELFAKVEGMSPNVLREGVPWGWETFPSFLKSLDGRLGINAASYVGHSALRRFVMGEAASERAATADELERMRALVREAMAAGAAGFSSSHAPTHVDQHGRPVPSRHASFDEVAALAETAGEGGAGSIAFLAETAVQGYDARDRQRLVELAHRSGLPVVVQGMGFRPGARERWDDQTRFLAEARDQGAAIYSMLRTQPFMRPFNWRRGTSLYDGVFHWRDLCALAEAERNKDQALLIEMNTPGGLLDSTRNIIEKILASPVPVIIYVTPSGSRAASAGFFILQSADVAAMAPGTNTGAAHPVTLGGGPEDIGKLRRFRELGVARVNATLPAEGADQILPILDRWAKLIGQMRAG